MLAGLGMREDHFVHEGFFDKRPTLHIVSGSQPPRTLRSSLSPIERRFWLMHQLYPGRPWPILAGSSTSKVPWTLGSYAQLSLSSLPRQCFARALSRRPRNPNWCSGPQLNFRLLRRRAKQTSTVQSKTSCGTRTTYRAVLSFAVVFSGCMSPQSSRSCRTSCGSRRLGIVARHSSRALFSYQGSAVFAGGAWENWRRQLPPPANADAGYWKDRLQGLSELSIPAPNPVSGDLAGPAYDAELKYPLTAPACSRLGQSLMRSCSMCFSPPGRRTRSRERNVVLCSRRATCQPSFF